MASNGTGVIVKTLSGIVMFGGLLSFMGYGIINNDIRNTKEHTAIRKEVMESVDKVDLKVVDLQIKQEVQIEILKRIEAQTR